MKPQILTHRGVESSKEHYFTESSFEAFEDQLNRGFGLEFDINFTKDDKIIVFHDAGLDRITQGGDKRLFSDMTLEEVRSLRLGGNELCSFDKLLEIIRNSKTNIHALHLKGKFQKKIYTDILLANLKQKEDLLRKIVIFDVKTGTAKYLKSNLPQIILAPSIAHPYDIKRYNVAVKGTLVPTEEAIKNKHLFDWVWLDEWDRTDEENKHKTFYNQKNFDLLRKHGFKIALVTPELHGTSSGLLGGEAHQDAKNLETLRDRLKEIIDLCPDAICTDYPDMAKELIKESKSCNI